MKQRFSSLDVRVIAHELSNSLVTLRLANVYDLSSKIFLLKFAKPDNKKQLVVDSGFRCHLTSFARTTAAAPSDFVARLRKYLKTRRVTSVSQVGTDRIIEFTFSDGQYRLFLEFYAGGNIILTDADLKILGLLRIVPEGEGQEELRVGLQYSLKDRQNFDGIPALTKERLQDALQKAVERGESDLVAGKKQKKKGADALRKALAVSITEFPPMLVDHAMRVTNFDASLKPADVLQSEELVDGLMAALNEAQNVINAITSNEITKGYIIAKKGKTEAQPEADGGIDPRKNLLYDDFHPFKPRQFEDDPSCVFLPFEGFNVTVDEFFSSIEGQKLESRLQEREATAKKKLEAARADQAKRLGGLQEVQELNVRKASAIEANVERIQEAMDAVNGLIAQGMDWVEIGKLIELQQKRNNPVASIIKLPLKLDENTITLLLGEENMGIDDDDDADETGSDVSDSDDEAPKKVAAKKPAESRLIVDINLGDTPWSNAREYYDQRRTAVVKEQKTLQSSTKALKSTEQKLAHDLRKGLKQEKAVLRPVRTQIWFEKFTFFISSDGYLVLGGRDAQQNEILYKKYLRKGDLYVHADIPGAGTVIVRNTHADAPIPPSTLSQAGTLAIACSSAWDSKAGMSAWWVNADQVSKSAPTGEFLPVGSFMVKGKKNFLPPAVLLLGFGVMFQISEQSKGKHMKHRLQEDQPVTSHDADATRHSEDENEVADKTDDDNEDEGDVQSDDDGASEKGSKPRANPLQSANKNIESTDISAEQSDAEADEVEDQNVSEVGKGVEGIELGEASTPAPVDHDSDSESEEDDVKSVPTPNGTSGQQSQSSKPTKGPAPLPRGKRGKAKKMANKYKDQDEDDRLAAQELIGASAGAQKAEEEAKTKAAKEAELAFHKERRRAQHQKTQAETAKHEELRKAMLENGEDLAVEDEEAQRLTPLDSFVGTPLPGDEILEAIPICAPWAALGKYKYKAKLQPGAQKKGKAVKEIIDRWVKAEGMKGALDMSSSDKERIWPREMELLKNWKAEECINCVPVSKVRVMMAGGNSGSASKDNKGKARGGKGGKRR